MKATLFIGGPKANICFAIQETKLEKFTNLEPQRVIFINTKMAQNCN